MNALFPTLGPTKPRSLPLSDVETAPAPSQRPSLTAVSACKCKVFDRDSIALPQRTRLGRDYSAIAWLYCSSFTTTSTQSHTSSSLAWSCCGRHDIRVDIAIEAQPPARGLRRRALLSAHAADDKIPKWPRPAPVDANLGGHLVARHRVPRFLFVDMAVSGVVATKRAKLSDHAHIGATLCQ